MAGVALPLVRGLRPHVAALTASGRTPTVAQIVGAVLVGAATLEVLAEAAAPTTSTLLHSRMVYRKVDAVFAHMRVIRAREASTFVHSRVIRGRAEGADLLHVRVIRDRAWLPLWDDDIQRPIGRAVLTR
jgi:hypothetical protein